MLNVKVTSTVFGNDEATEKVPDIELTLVSEKISLREIIKRTVIEQIKGMELDSLTKQQIAQRLSNQYLNNEDIKQLSAEGKVSYASATKIYASPDPEAEVIKAINAFKRKKFKVFIDGEEIISLTDYRALYEGCVINFVRLIPLIGG